MSKRRSRSVSGWWAAVFSVAILAAASCRAPDGGGAAVESRTSALDGVTSTNLQLQVSKNICTSNLAQDYFKITNSSSTPVPLSQIVVKYWINDTSAGTMAPSVAYGGCVTSSNGSCVHPVSGVTATATRFSPACGTDAAHQASWEIAISTTDTAPLAPGQTWSNVQTAVNLASYANFVPGTATWFSSCGSGKPYVADPNFAVYDNGDLVSSQGAQAPLCRAPAIVQIQTYIDRTFYATSDVNSSFVSSQGEQIDCISFAAQRSVKAWLAAGVAMPTTVPALPAAPAGTPPPNVAPNLAFVGQPDVNGHPQQCPAGFVPTTRPTVAQVQAAGGLAAYQFAQAHPPRVTAGRQDSTEHDCWINPVPNGGTVGLPGDGTVATANTVDWEHTAAVQNGGWLPAGASGFFGMDITTPVYKGFVQPEPTVSSGRSPEVATPGGARSAVMRAAPPAPEDPTARCRAWRSWRSPISRADPSWASSSPTTATTRASVGRAMAAAPPAPTARSIPPPRWRATASWRCRRLCRCRRDRRRRPTRRQAPRTSPGRP